MNNMKIRLADLSLKDKHLVANIIREHIPNYDMNMDLPILIVEQDSSYRHVDATETFFNLHTFPEYVLSPSKDKLIPLNRETKRISNIKSKTATVISVEGGYAFVRVDPGKELAIGDSLYT